MKSFVVQLGRSFILYNFSYLLNENFEHLSISHLDLYLEFMVEELFLTYQFIPYQDFIINIFPLLIASITQISDLSRKLGYFYEIIYSSIFVYLSSYRFKFRI